MSEFPTFDRLAEEHLKVRPKRRVGLKGRLFIAILLLALGIDYMMFGARASRIQGQLERTLAALPLPQDTVQVDYDSGHQTHKGHATRILLSRESPREICDFYMRKLQDDAWVLQHEDCETASNDFVPIRSNYVILELRRGGTTFEFSSLGRNLDKNRYSLMLMW